VIAEPVEKSAGEHRGGVEDQAGAAIVDGSPGRKSLQLARL